MMYIMNQSQSKLEKLKKFKVIYEYDKKTLQMLEGIRRGISSKYHRSTMGFDEYDEYSQYSEIIQNNQAMNEEIQNTRDAYLKENNCEKSYKFIVNGKEFASYRTKERTQDVMNQIFGNLNAHNELFVFPEDN